MLDRLRLGLGMHLASAAMLFYGVLVVYIRSIPLSPASSIALIAVTLAILILTTRIDLIGRLGFPAYFAIQIALVTACMILGRGIVSLHYMPLVSQAALVCRRRTVVVICIGFAISHAAFGVYFWGWENAGIELVAFTGVLVFVIAVTEMAAAERRARTALGAAHEKLAEHAAGVEQLATMQERNRLAREIHDSLGHYLTVIHVQLQAASSLIASDAERAAAAILRARDLTREGLEEVRRSVAALRASPAQDRPLPEAIAALVGELTATGTPATLSVRGEPRALPPTVALTLFRTAQEALTNVRKHASAARAEVELAYGASAVELTVADDGRGASEPDRGFGLLGVRERVALIGGRVEVATSPGAGFRLRVEAPG